MKDKRMLFTFRHLFLACALAVPSAVVVATPAWSVPTEQESAVPAGAIGQDPQAAWDAWLQENHVDNGANGSPGKDFRYFAYSQASVGVGDPDKFINRRNVAFEKAMLQVKSDVAQFVRIDIESGGGVTVRENNGEEAPPMAVEAARQLSVIEKLHALGDKALDAKLKDYDASWDGTGKTEAQRQKRVVELEENFRRQISSQARLMVSGALPVAVFEGTGSDGKYMVGVGVVWSPRLERRALSIVDPSVPPEPSSGEGTSIGEQIRAKIAQDRNFLAVANGISIWRNNKGEPVILAFSSADASQSQMRNDEIVRTLGATMIKNFVAEKIAVKNDADQTLTDQYLASKKQETFDSTKFSSSIASEASKLSLSGVGVVYKWTGEHPVSKSRMVVSVLSWTPSSRDMAGQIAASAQAQEQAIQRAGVAATAAPVGGMPSGGQQTAPLRRGNTTSAGEF